MWACGIGALVADCVETIIIGTERCKLREKLMFLTLFPIVWDGNYNPKTTTVETQNSTFFQIGPLIEERCLESPLLLL